MPACGRVSCSGIYDNLLKIKIFNRQASKKKYLLVWYNYYFNLDQRFWIIWQLIPNLRIITNGWLLKYLYLKRGIWKSQSYKCNDVSTLNSEVKKKSTILKPRQKCVEDRVDEELAQRLQGVMLSRIEEGRDGPENIINCT